ncbi:MAG TPA: WYL domain-containing protein [Candidatus Brocadiia bacterium]|nr:WYL domain-containing protein [Candidatus Brocadiia bacterium]
MPDPVAQRLTRILTMIAYVRRRPEGVPIGELTQYLGCTREELVADIDAALLCGAPPYLPSDYINAGIERGRVFISLADHISRPIALTLQEALAVLLALDSLPAGMAANEVVRGLRGRILGLFPGQGRREIQRIGRRLRLGGQPGPLGQTLGVLEEAIRDSEEVRIEYYTASRDAMSERVVRPYGLVEQGGMWYAVGWCLMRDRELPFRVDRIRRIEKTGQRFDPPKDFDIARYAREEMYFPTSRDLHAAIRLAPDLVRWVMDERFAGAIEPQEDGAAVLTLSVSRWEWLLSWLLQYGPKAEALRPPALRSKMIEACDAALANYAEAAADSAVPAP